MPKINLINVGTGLLSDLIANAKEKLKPKLCI